MRNTMFICLLAIFLPLSTWAEEEMYLEGISVLGSQKGAYLSIKDGGNMEVREGDKVGIWMVVKIEERSIFLTMESGKTIELPLHSRLPSVADQDPKSATDQASATDQVLPSMADQDPLSEVQELESKTPQTDEKATAETPPAETPTPATAEEIPPGHRKVHTPFGDFVVKEEEAVKQDQDNSQVVPPPVKKEFAPAAKEEPVPVDHSAGVNKSVPPPSPEEAKSSPAEAKSSPEKAKSSPDPATPAKTEEPIPPGYRKVQTPFGEFVVKDKTEKAK